MPEFWFALRRVELQPDGEPMSALNKLPASLRPRREKEYGPARGIPLDRNAKARILAYAQGYNAKHKTERQHQGPITWAFLRVLQALLYGFHNAQTGLCFPSYEAIAEKARCSRTTVYEAIRFFESIGLLTWVNRIVKIQERCVDLFGQLGRRWRMIRTSNAYLFRDPLPCAAPANVSGGASACSGVGSSKFRNPTGTPIQDSISSTVPPKIIVLDPANPIDEVLIRLGQGIGAIK